ncbi:4Fe-4S binding protein [Methanogenium marinum]|uniref:4Fe-4S binding protein n=1 Tax=Methanogenium marinum TaxID=348610 RepID=A0A9Q4PYJ2_9EURY|nr:4Fe-4S dicluster domain-containing protein [Methanogenium marinum]MDE4908818.1 4Fe-4S binding protein [Methanogenium marinum]
MNGGKNNRQQGVLHLREKGVVSLRVKAVAGFLSAEQLEALARTARDYGQGEVCTTARLNLEIPGISKTDVTDAAAALSAADLVLGSTGPSVRSVVSCKGTICRHGCCDTFGIARQLEETEGGRPLPRKLKIAIAGCPNNCSRVQFNDIGFMGHRYPRFTEEECTQCGACETVCKEDAITMGDDGIVFSPKRCIGCGDCIAVCPKDAVSIADEGLSLFLGGRAGRKIRFGTEVKSRVAEMDVPAITERIITYFAENACDGERFGQMMDRLGDETVFRDLGLYS